MPEGNPRVSAACMMYDHEGESYWNCSFQIPVFELSRHEEEANLMKIREILFDVDDLIAYQEGSAIRIEFPTLAQSVEGISQDVNNREDCLDLSVTTCKEISREREMFLNSLRNRSLDGFRSRILEGCFYGDGKSESPGSDDNVRKGIIDALNRAERA